MQDSPNKRTESDEIDLRQLFAAIGNFFANIGKGIVNAIIRVKRRTLEYRWLIVIVIVSGGLLGAFYSYKSDPVYTSSLLLRSEYLNRRIVDNAIEKLNLLSKEENKAGLAKVLGIDPAVADKIVEFYAEPFVAEEEVVEVELFKERLSRLDLTEEEVSQIIARIAIENVSTYQIYVSVNESTVIGNLDEALLNYFKNNRYISDRIKINEQNLLARKAKLIEEDKKLDSLKGAMINAYKSMSSKSKQGSDNLYIGEQYSANPIQIFQEDLKLHQEILAIDKKLYLQSDFELIDGMTEFTEPASKGTLAVIALAMLISLGLAYFLILVLEISKYLERVEEKEFAK